jgi:hypothetical protein
MTLWTIQTIAAWNELERTGRLRAGAWHRWNGPRCRPDLRCSGHLAKGEEGVRLKLECPADRVLLSDFSLWHYALNYWYLPSSEADGDAFERELARHGFSFYEQKPLPHHRYHAAIVESWDRCLDLDWHEPDIALPVVECRRFTSR